MLSPDDLRIVLEGSGDGLLQRKRLFLSRQGPEKSAQEQTEQDSFFPHIGLL
jgi:hypothetical protein